MSFSMFNFGGPIQIQYEVFRKMFAPELVWYSGTITALEMLTDKTVKITVMFEGSETFAECDETFIADDAGKLSQKGKDFPFRFPNLRTEVDSISSHGIEVLEDGKSNSVAQVMTKVSCMEKRLKELERNLTSQSIPAIYMTVCCMLNKSLKKFKNTKHKLHSTADEITAATLNVTQTCTYSDFKMFIAYLKKLPGSLDVSGNSEETTASPNITISIPSFKVFCSLFSIADYYYKVLLSCQQLNRKGQLTSFKCIGSIIANREIPSLPSILCLGGNAQVWCDSNSFFAKENSHTLSTGGYACDYERLLTRQLHTSHRTALGDLKGSDLTVTWSIDDSSEICRPIQEGLHFIGKLSITIPYVIFNDATVATNIHKCMCLNRKFSDSTDSSIDESED